MKIINYLFIIILIIFGVFACGKDGSLFLSDKSNEKWIKINNLNEN
jgi:hypothetical protein